MFTSYFANVKKLPPDLVPVSIARGSPRWFTGKKELRLAPTWAMLKMQKPEYDAGFAEILAKLDPAEIYQTLGENAVLLCWEKPGDACHRRLVAEWLEAALGIEIPEYGFDRIACPAYEEMIWAVKRRARATPDTPQPAVPSRMPNRRNACMSMAGVGPAARALPGWRRKPTCRGIVCGAN